MTGVKPTACGKDYSVSIVIFGGMNIAVSGANQEEVRLFSTTLGKVREPSVLK